MDLENKLTANVKGSDSTAEESMQAIEKHNATGGGRVLILNHFEKQVMNTVVLISFTNMILKNKPTANKAMNTGESTQVLVINNLEMQFRKLTPKVK